MLQNQEIFTNQMGLQYDKGLIKGNPGSGFEIVETMEERDQLLQERREQEKREDQLNIEVN